MSKTIDQKVVEMQFDNRQFEKNVSTTMTSVEKLKQSLNFSGAGKGLENVSAAAKKVDMNGLSSAVETVRTRFSALEVMGVTALANITNSAVNAGKRIISALTIDPIKTGFQEYETQINSVQTILANTQSKGSTLSDVNAALDELNKYADQTIYNFTEMTRNIGTFTAAGVDLDKSVTSIKGIANLAAVSGSSAQQASTAMYQLSQALAAGKVSLMDWNSVVNAGMGGQVFQDALKRTAENFGYNVDGMIEKYGSFRESLTEGGWLTAEVLTETLTQLSGAYTEADLIAQGYSEQQAKEITELAQTAVDAATKVKTFTQLWDTLKEAAQSGWTQTWEILVGDFEEAKGLLTELSETFGEIIQSSADARNNLLYDAMTSNWKKITDGITEAGLSAEDFKNKVSETAKAQGVDVDAMVKEYGSLESAFKNGAISSDILNQALTKMTGTSEEIAKKQDELRGKYKTNKDLLDALTKAGYEQSDIQELVAKDTEGQIIALNDLSDAQLMSIGYTADQVSSIRELANYAELAGGSLKTFMDNVAVPQGRELLIDSLRVSLRSLIAVFERVGAAWREIFPPTTSDQLLGIIQSLRDFVLSLRPTEDTLDNLQRTFRGLFSILSIGKQAISGLLKPIGTLLSHFTGLSGGVLELTASFGDWLYSVSEGMKAGNAFAVIGDGISVVLEKILDTINYVVDGIGGFGGVLSSIGNTISNVFEGVFDVVSRVFNWIRENISAGDIFAGLAGGGIFMFVKKLGGFIDQLKDLFSFGGDDEDGLRSQFGDILESVHGSLETFQQGIQVGALIGIAAAVTLLVSALKKVSEIDATKVGYSLVTIRLLIASLNSGFKSLSKTLLRFNAKGTIKASLAMIAIAEAVNILADAIVKFKDLSWNEILKGLTGISGSMVALSASLRLIGKGGVTLRTSLALIALAHACKMLAEAFKEFGGMEWDEIGKGLVAMGAALAEFTAVMAVLSKVGGGRSLLGATSILIAVQSLDEISENLERLGNLSWEQIGKGLVAMGGALTEFTAALAVLSKVGGFGALLGGTAILIAVQSLDEISENLKRLGSMSWDEIGKGLTAMGGALTELGAVSGLLGKLAGFSGLLGATTILIAVQGLGDLADALMKFGDMAWDTIGRGLVAMGGALTELGIVSGLLGKLAGMSGLMGATTILIAVQGLGDLADALQKFGSMSWDEIGRGLAAMGGALLELGAISGATGYLTGIAGLVGAGTILLAVQGLDDLANALIKFGSMSWDEIGRGLAAMGAAMGETALGGLLNTFSGFGASAIAEIAAPLGDLADSIKKWEGIEVPEGLGTQLGSLAGGVMSFNFSGWGAEAIAAVAIPIGSMADSIKKWQGVSIPETLGDQLSSLATGVKAFNFSGWGADAIAATAPALGSLADSIRKWQTVMIPEELGDRLEELADGVGAFSFAFVGSWSISSLVDPLSDLADTVSKWNKVTIPDGIGEGLQDLADGVGAFSLAFTAGWTIGNLVEPLGELAGSVQKWNSVTLSGVGAGLNELASGLETLGEVGVKGIVKQFDGAADKLKSSVNRMLSGISEAVNSKKGEIGTPFVGIVSDALKEMEKKIPDFKNSGTMIMTNILNGLDTKKTAFKTTLVSYMKDALSSVRGEYQSFYSVGSYLVTGFANGIKSNSSATAAARTLAKSVLNSMKKELQIHSPSRVVRDEVGKYIVEGLSEGITSDMSAEEAASQKAQNITNAFQEEFEKLDVADQTDELERQLSEQNDDYTNRYESQLKRVELALAKYQNTLQVLGKDAIDTQKAYNEYLQEEVDLRELEAEKTQAAYEASIEAIEERKAASTMSLVDELAAYKRLQSAYVAGSQQRIEIDQKVLELQEQLADATREYYDNLKSIQEESESERTQIDQDYEDQRTQIKEDANQKRLELDEEYAAKEKEIQDNLASNIEQVEQAYEDAVQSRTDTLYDSYGLFDKVDQKEPVSGDTLLKNLQDQLTAFSDWTSNLNALSGRGLEEEMIEELREMGPSSAAEIKALNEMTDEQLAEYVELWKQKHQLAKDQSIYELQGMREETDQTIKDLKDDAEKELEDYRKTWNDQLDELNKETDQKLADLKRTWRRQIEDLDDETDKKLEDLKSNWMESVLGIKMETENQFVLMTQDVVNILGNNNKWSQTGANMIEGVLMGVVNNTPKLVDGVEDAMRQALNAANRTLGIRSPSKEFAKIGRYSNEGFVEGLKKYSGLVSETAGNVGNQALNSLRDSISKISDAINGKIDAQPTIRPVLDLSDLEAGASQLNTMFSRNQALSISTGMKKGQVVSDTDDPTAQTKPGTVYQFTQNNYSPKALSRVEIYRQSNNLFSAYARGKGGSA